MHSFDILLPTVLLLCCGFIVILLSRFLRISPVIGFLLAGIGLGPHGFGMIEETETTALLAKLGVVFLLFDIGLHFSAKSLWSRRRDILGLAPLQVILCGAVIGIALMYILGLNVETAVLVGLALALSSTAVVMQILADFRQTSSPTGQSAKSDLVLQDIAAIFLMIFADVLGGDAALSGMIGMALAKTVIAVAAVIALGHFVLTPLMKMIIRYDDPEMFTILGLLIVMVTGLATAEAGLSLTLGAFLAGMVLAETPFRVLLQTELRPFRSLLMAFFFTTVGMMLNPIAVWQNPTTVLVILSLITIAKAAVIVGIMLIMKRPAHYIVHLSLLLAQSGEFAFVIFSIGNVQEIIGTGATQDLIAAVALSMMMAPLISILGNQMSLKLCSTLKDKISNCPDGDKNPVVHQPVFIIGMNDVGRTLARGLRANDIPYIAVEHDRKRFLQATAAGFIVAYGDPGDLRFWNMLDVRSARAICVAAPRFDVARNVAPIIDKLYPKLSRYVAVGDSSEGVRFSSLGLKPFHSHGTPPGLEMTCHVLRQFEIGEEQINDWVADEQSIWLDSNTNRSLSVVDDSQAA